MDRRRQLPHRPHTVTGALGGGVNGALGAAVSASAAPILEQLQNKVQSVLETQGMSPLTAKNLAQGLAQLTSASIGSAVGGDQGAATALTVDTNNRQLHPKEIDWINAKAKEYAAKKGISEDQAKAELAQQALRSVDAAWATYLGGTANVDAQAFLDTAKTTGAFTNEAGQTQAFFSKQTGDYMNGLINHNSISGNPDNLAFYQHYIQPGKQNDAMAGLVKLGSSQAGNGLIQLPGAILDGVSTLLTNNPLTTAKAMVNGMYDSAVDAGTALGGSAAALADNNIKNSLNAIYGDPNANKLVGALAAMPAVTMVGGAVVGGTVTTAVGKGAGKVVDKTVANGLEDAAKADKAAQAALAKAKPISTASIDLTTVQGKASFLANPVLSNIIRNDGKLGEQAASQIMKDATGIDFRSIQNASGNGIDLIGIDPVNKTIWAPEVKASTIGKFPDPNSLNLQQRTKDWIDAAVIDGKIANQQLSSADAAYAYKIQQLIINDGYTLKPMVVNVDIPKPGLTGVVKATMTPIP